MNKLNYASPEASKKLVDNGILLETDFYWRVWPERGEWKRWIRNSDTRDHECADVR